MMLPLRSPLLLSPLRSLLPVSIGGFEIGGSPASLAAAFASASYVSLSGFLTALAFSTLAYRDHLLGLVGMLTVLLHSVNRICPRYCWILNWSIHPFLCLRLILYLGILDRLGRN